MKFRHLRYLVLLMILFAVAGNEIFNRYKVASWDEPLSVRVYAINGDLTLATRAYIAQLDIREFAAIEAFVNREARRYGVDSDAIRLEYGGVLPESPPPPPRGGSVLQNIVWSLSFRAWTFWRELVSDLPGADINLYVNYYDLATTRVLPHSVGLRGGLVALINAFASPDYRGSNHVVIAHELMHTFGAGDKYGPGNQPLHPGGYADAFQDPLYPQKRAEIMGGRIPLAPNRSRIPESLSEVVVGVHTAVEIHWPVE